MRGVRDARQTRDAVLLSAMKAIRLRGYQAASLDDVLRESGVGKGNFYYHFRSKEDLGYAIVDRISTSFLRDTLEPCFADPSGDPLTQIRCFLDRVIELQRSGHGVGGCPLGSLASELANVHEGFRARLQEVFSAWRAQLGLALVRAQHRGLVGADCQPDCVAQFLVASLEGAMLMTKLTRDVGVMEQCVAELRRYLGLYRHQTEAA